MLISGILMVSGTSYEVIGFILHPAPASFIMYTWSSVNLVDILGIKKSFRIRRFFVQHSGFYFNCFIECISHLFQR